MKPIKAEDIDFKASKHVNHISYLITYRVNGKKTFVATKENLGYQLNYFRQFGFIITNEKELYQTLANTKLETYNNIPIK